VSPALTGKNLNLTFATYLDLPYLVEWKADLAAPDWLVLTNLSGDGEVTSVFTDLQSTSRFYRVVRLCN
jgi:hypothetical protein